VWRARFGGAADVVGRSLAVDGVPRTVVGVVPDGVSVPEQGADPTAVWLPLNVDSADVVNGFARLRRGVTSAAASRELHALLRTLADTGALQRERAQALTPQELLSPGRRRAVELLFVAAVGLLLIACADVAGLLLMRGWTRRREFAIRRALGAWRGRLARQLLTESLLLAAPAGALGLLVAWLGVRAAAALRGTFFDAAAVRLDATVFLWTAAASAATALLFGIGPALLAGRQPLDGALRTGGAGTGRSGVTTRAHAALVVGQIALSLVFLAAAGVLARSFVALARTPVGYEREGLVAVTVRRAPTPGRAPARRLAPAERAATAQALREALAATPGVSEVAVGTLPLTHMGVGPAAVEGPAGVRPVGVPVTGMAYVSPEYFRVARIPIARGRGLDASPEAAAAEVVINQALARRLWPERDAVGARLRLGDGNDAEWLTVVGVAGDVQLPGSTAEFFGLQMYRPTGAAPLFDGTLLLRARGDPAALRPTLARAVERAGVGATLGDVVAAESTIAFVYAGPRFTAALFGAFALLAVVLAAVGLFGIVSYAVARRTREIGVRVALGADPAALTRTILGQGIRLVAVGCATGLLGAFGASRALTALVFGVSPADPAALGGAVALLAAVALAASALPLRRALRVDPADTLRAE
jgi:predicted permease